MRPARIAQPLHSAINVSESRFEGHEREYVNDCIDREWITQGVYVRRFERSFAEICGVEHAIACSSGTSALHLALIALGVGPDSTVIVPALTYVATANAARYCGAKVLFCDIDRETWCMDPTSYRKAAEGYPDPSGESVPPIALPVHLFDALADVDALDGAEIVEDAAHAPGSAVSGRPVGSLGKLAAFSFYASKVIACGEGGMVTTDDDELADAVRLYRGQGATVPGRYYHKVVGYNYRMTDLQAAVGLAQLEQLTRTLSHRRQLIDRYRDRLAASPVQLQGGERASGWIFAALLPRGIDRDVVAARLRHRGVETRPFFEPLPSLPPYSAPVPPVAADVARRGLCFPTHTAMATEDVDYVCDCLLGEIK